MSFNKNGQIKSIEQSAKKDKAKDKADQENADNFPYLKVNNIPGKALSIKRVNSLRQLDQQRQDGPNSSGNVSPLNSRGSKR